MGEIDPRVTLSELRPIWKAHGGSWHGPRVEHWMIPEANVVAAVSAILAALDAARPVAPKSVITWRDRAMFGSALDDAARPVEPLPEYDATDAIERAIANWSTISDEPPADEEVAGLVERLRSLADLDARSGEPLGKCMREAADIIERLSARWDDMIKAQEIRAKVIREQTARATAAEAEVADLRARLAKFINHADQSPTSVARGVGGMTVDANMRGTRVHVSQWEVEELRTALAPKEPAP